MHRSWRLLCGFSVGLVSAVVACGGGSSGARPSDDGGPDDASPDVTSSEASAPDTGTMPEAGLDTGTASMPEAGPNDASTFDGDASDAGSLALVYDSTIALPGVVSGMAYDAADDLLWVACATSPSVPGSVNAMVVVDASDKVTTLSGVPDPQPTVGAYRHLAVAPGQHELFTWSEPEAIGSGVGVWDTSTRAYVTTVAMPDVYASLGLAVDETNGKVLVLGTTVADGGQTTALSVIDAKTNARVGSVPLVAGGVPMTLAADGAHGRAIAFDGAHAYVVDESTLALTAVVPLNVPPADAGMPYWLLAGVAPLPDGNVAAFDSPNLAFEGQAPEARVFSVGAPAFEHDVALPAGFAPFYLTTVGGGSVGADASVAPPAWLLLGTQGNQPAVLSLDYAAGPRTVTNLGGVPFVGAELPGLTNLYPGTAGVWAPGAGAPRFYASFAASAGTTAKAIGLARFTLVGP
jgi:hypothetical protein